MISNNNNNKERVLVAALLRRKRKLRIKRKFLLWFTTILLILSFLYTYMKIILNNQTTTITHNKIFDIPTTTLRKTTTSASSSSSSSSSPTTSTTTSSIKTITNNDNNNIIIIAAGLGTTGTHLMYKTTCYMGYKSVHYNLGCINIDDLSSNTSKSKSNNASTNTNNTTRTRTESSLSLLIRQPFNIHKKLIGKVSTLSKCLQSTTKKLCGNAILWKQDVESIINELIMDSTNLVAFHDNPYPYFVDTFVKVAKKHNKQHIVLLSERSPTEWLKRRIETNHISGDIMCKESILLLDDDSTTDNNATSTTSTTTTTTASSSGLDLLGCIDDAIVAVTATAGNNIINNNSLLDLKDVFVSLKHVSKNPNFRKIMNINGDFPRIIIPQPTIVNEIRRYQDHIRDNVGNFTYNMFTQINKTDISTLGDMILNEIPMLDSSRKDQSSSSSNPNNNHNNQTTTTTKVITYVNWWKGTVE